MCSRWLRHLPRTNYPLPGAPAASDVPAGTLIQDEPASQRPYGRSW